MLTLLFTCFLTLPLYPLNPVEQDTLAMINLHVTAGFNAPNRFGSISPELTGKYEMLFKHPFVLRAACDYRYGTVSSVLYPHGNLHSVTVSLEGLYYRGTNTLTGYVGLGPLVGFNYLSLSTRSADSLRANLGITGVRIRPSLGYRLTIGLRYHRAYSLELSVSQLRPTFVYTSRFSPTTYSETTDKVRLSDVRLTLGYLISLRGL